jgi:hypothetical protein
MTLTEIENSLSPLAKKILRSGSTAPSAKRLIPEGPARRELLAAKLIGQGNGLTIKGSALAARLAHAHEHELFPL